MVQKLDSIIIIGGGLAGLSAATKILAEGYSGNLTLLEKSPFLGGRAASIDYRGREVNLGEHLLTSGFKHYRKFLRRVDLESAVEIKPKLDVEFRDAEGNKPKVESSHLPSPFHLASSFIRFPTINKREKLKLIRLLLSMLLVEAKHKERRRSFGEWLRSKGIGERLINEFWNPIIVPTLNASVNEVSFSMGMMVVKQVLLNKSDGKLGRLTVPLSRIGEQSATFIEERGGRVKLRSRVTSIEISDEEQPRLKLANGEMIEADLLISAVPGHQLVDLLSAQVKERFLPPFWKLQWNPILNVHLIFEKGVMKSEYFGYLNDLSSWVFNLDYDKQASGQHVCLTLSAPKNLINKKPGELVNLAKEELSLPLPKVQNTTLQDSFVLYQPQATIITTPESQTLRPSQNPPLPRVFLAGDWTDTGWPSTMEGATKSGHMAAREIINSFSF